MMPEFAQAELEALRQQPAVRRIHIAEALSYRRLNPTAAPARRPRSA